MTRNVATPCQPADACGVSTSDETNVTADHSRYVQRVRRRYADLLNLLPPLAATPGERVSAPDFQALKQTYERLREPARGGHDTGAALRILRQLVLERMAVLDVEHQAPLQTICQGMTTLAEFALETACAEALTTLDATHGPACKADGARCKFWVLGMGKLGARELNVSSDIDLIYVYEEDGETAGDAQGRHRISNHEYFAKAVRAMGGLLADVTEHGFVFRVDLALRPNGNSGPTACSLDALEAYFHAQGREWERLAWLKSRVVAPRARIEDSSGKRDDSVMALRALVTPFVFRRYLDYNVFEALRVLHRQIREHANKRSAGRPERSNDVKLSRGGIREIEFIVQLLQVVRGGQFPELRTRPTLTALQRLAAAGLMPAATAAALAEAYVFLRKVEHRIQYLDDQQTHVLPTQDADLRWMARSLGYLGSRGCGSDICDFLTQLDAHREVVAQEFDTLLGNSPPGPDKDCRRCSRPADAALSFETLRAHLPIDLHERYDLWHAQPRVQALSETAQGRLLRLLERSARMLKLAPQAAEGAIRPEPAATLAFTRLLDWLEPLLRRESYLALLLERPAVHERLLRLLGAARWPARYLLLHPGVIDELAGRELLTARFDPIAFENELETRRKALRDTGDGDEEALLNLLRRAHHAEVFRTLARDVEKHLSVEEVADDLSALADAVLRVSTRWCWDALRKKHRTEPGDGPQIGVIGYGKLGGKELGYGSDLDIVFVYEDAHDDAPEVYALLVRKLVNWLTVKTGEGDLYEIDTALRPNGNSGLLITSFDAYANYQQQRGSNTAWTWEHQAMTRARFVLGDDALRQRFDAVRDAVICAPRDPQALREEILGMRERVRQAHAVPEGQFDVKQSAGGMMDVEFAVQFLVLSQAAHHPELRRNSGNIALLRAAEASGLLPTHVGAAAADAYRELRRIQHQARLDEVTPQVPLTQVQVERAAVLALWAAVFETDKRH
ncbi:bifunctional [glutamate--ammonia ligase]-adenylyl-L-tyrosine phosphorylase/[glutamate--ammonia-ligase] adenylyltransferase [Hylemonella gracilis]|uniref:Bifunctional glutamine synthetase adenylyltransferase/adenylyl-removing enzyme n=1 Tax=Hylemonella gracilis ATCC 19624 TaxID=887062 RepID=F3KWN4_9BURK|nr:bifunctional [glutamate--ammonia ligase]-adenylyl-L-tyrosine phosphorylase/[glutamate--ammonia-ligase] adenylyltransferase [Hylemonella gracilis]EGI75671.1 (glutamate--ammonia-ligase) adenylyltransferase [Hylemonella gracilis ATCC 19624]